MGGPKDPAPLNFVRICGVVPQTWTMRGQPRIELGSAANIARQGVTVKTLTPGTVVTVTLYPQRNGANQGAIAGPLVLCGMTMPTGGCTAQTGTVMKPPAN